MKMTYLDQESAIIEFVKRAAENFKEFSNNRSYTDEDIKAGCLFAMKYGLDNDCILVFKLDEDFEPINFQQAIRDEFCSPSSFPSFIGKEK